MPDFLVFQVYGNLASWGDIAVGEHRPVQPYPTKSAVSGLIAACLGLRRDNDEPHQRLNDDYGVAVCVLSQGELLRDYHTTQVPAGNKNWFTRKDELSFDPLGLKTILSQRDYQMDAFYLVAVWQKESSKNNELYSLDELANALRQPVFVTSLGRKSCPPSLPYHPKIMKETSLKNACDAYDLPDELKYSLHQDELITWHWEHLSKNDSGMEHTMVYTRRDQVRSRKRWQFSKRDEYYFAEPRQDTGRNKSGGSNVL